MKRFVNQDILIGDIAERQSLNRFAFVTGQPISLLDPFGLAKICGQCAIGAENCLLYGYNLCEPGTASIAPDFQKSLSFPSHLDSFPLTSDTSACNYYDFMASKQGCNYHSNAANICRGNPDIWSDLANLLLEACGSITRYPIDQVKNCVRSCLVYYDAAIARGIFPSCKIHCGHGICTHLDCIDAYHHTCFDNCGISEYCYGGNYDFSSLVPSLFYDKCPTESECILYRR